MEKVNEKVNEIVKSKVLREIMIVLSDIIISMISFVIAFFLTQVNIVDKTQFEFSMLNDMFLAMLLATSIVAVFLFLSGVYKIVWRCAKPWNYARILVGVIVGTIIFGLIDSFGLHLLQDAVAALKGVEKGTTPIFTTYISYAILCVAILIVVRITYQAIVIRNHNKKLKMTKRVKKRTLIIGGGFAGNTILDEFNSYPSEYEPICILDDAPDMQGRVISGIKVVGKIKNIAKVCDKYGIQTIIFAIPSLVGDRKVEILNECTATRRELKIIPSLTSLVENSSYVKQIRDVDVADLLGREQIRFEEMGIKEYIEGKTVMITGGGGSIGSEICRQLLKYFPKRIVIVEVYENCAYNIQQEILGKNLTDVDFLVEILSVTDYDKLEEIYKQYHPDIVFHAAAHKHVPLMETNPEEAVKNNIYGTYNTMVLADKYDVERFILISTDKAVNPTNVMGATKRCCEKIMQMMSRKSKGTKFAAVRFGNVLGSNGSVIPLFKRQIAQGGPVTVTHKDIIRYFMTIPEAVSLVLQAGAYAQSGEIFVLDMGEQVKITTLAENLIKAMGYKPYEEIEIKFTGLRPGEKLYEELLMSEEGLQKTDNKKIFIGQTIDFSDEEFEKDLQTMKDVCQTNDKEQVIDMLKVLVPTFKHDREQFDKMQEHSREIILEFTSKMKMENKN